MQKNLPYVAILIILVYALYNAKFRDNKKVQVKVNKEYTEHLKTHKETSHFEEELSKLKTDAYVKQYIINVINHGSAQFEFKGGVMEEGFASKDYPDLTKSKLLGIEKKENYLKTMLKHKH